MYGRAAAIAMAVLLPSEFDDIGAPLRGAVEGLLGNALFLRDYLVILDLPHRRFGVLPRSAKQ
jgi:hypothetical protein